MFKSSTLEAVRQISVRWRLVLSTEFQATWSYREDPVSKPRVEEKERKGKLHIDIPEPVPDLLSEL